MERSVKKWTGNMLLILFIFLGVCFGNTNTESFIMYQTAQQEFSYGETLILKSCKGIPCIMEMLETYNVIELMNDTIKRSSDKINRNLLILLLVTVVLQILSNSNIAVNRSYSPVMRKKAVVLNYIHNKDGKK